MIPKHRVSRKEVAALPVRSEAEETLAGQLRMLKIPHEREYEFVVGRKFRADFLVWAAHSYEFGQECILVEVDGGGWVQGHHARGKGIEDDCEKSALAAINGYRVIHCTPKQVDSGQCVAWIEAALRRAA